MNDRLRCWAFSHPGFQRVDGDGNPSRCVRCGTTLNDALRQTHRAVSVTAIASATLAGLAIVLAIAAIIGAANGGT